MGSFPEINPLVRGNQVLFAGWVYPSGTSRCIQPTRVDEASRMRRTNSRIPTLNLSKAMDLKHRVDKWQSLENKEGTETKKLRKEVRMWTSIHSYTLNLVPRP